MLDTPSSFYSNVYLSGNNILFRGYEDGKRSTRRVPFSPTLYVQSNKPTSFKTITGEYVEEVFPGTIKESKEFVERYEGVDGFKIYGNTTWICQYISSLYPQHEDAHFDTSLLRVLFLDIETESEDGFSSAEDAKERINAITMSFGKKKWVLALGEFKLDDPNIDQRIYDNDADLLEDFIKIWQEIDPDIVSGWFCEIFDIPYICNRITKLFNEDKVKLLSPWRMISKDMVENRGKESEVYRIRGVAILDYYNLYRKYTYNQQESYKLDHIAFTELGKKKLDYSEFESIRDFYRGNFQKFIEYNVVDVDLVQQLDDKLKLLNLHVSLAYIAKVNYEDVFSQSRVWDAIIYNHLLKQNIVIPFKVHKEKTEQFVGAYVKEPKPGMYNWVVSFDVASLYPNIIRFINISPETILEKKLSLKIEDLMEQKVDLGDSVVSNYSVGANGACFKKEKQGFLGELVTHFYNMRKNAKKEMVRLKKEMESSGDTSLASQIKILDTKQQAAKISINALYGILGTPYFRFYNIDQAEAVTQTGQLIIRYLQQELNIFLNKVNETTNIDYCIMSDTDSVFLNMETFVKKYCEGKSKDETYEYINKFCDQILGKFIAKRILKISEYLNAFENSIEMVRDVIADRGFVTGKKRYALNVLDQEGVHYKEPKLKIMGIEVQRSSTPKVCRDKLKESIKIILTKDQETLIAYIDQFKKDFKNCSVEEIAFPRGVNSLAEYADENMIYKKGTPIAVKGALIYNNLLDKFKVKKKYTAITTGDKVKFLYLKEPNSTGTRVISFSSKLPKEFKLADRIDYDLQFEKAFLDPITHILNAIGWQAEHKNTLESFFG